MGFSEDMKEGLVDPVHLVSDSEHREMEELGLDPESKEDIETFKGGGGKRYIVWGMIEIADDDNDSYKDVPDSLCSLSEYKTLEEAFACLQGMIDKDRQ